MLNRVRREQPKLWNWLLNMPDGLRAASTADDDSGSTAGYTLTLVVNAKVDQDRRVDAC